MAHFAANRGILMIDIECVFCRKGLQKWLCCEELFCFCAPGRLFFQSGVYYLQQIFGNIDFVIGRIYNAHNIVQLTQAV